MPAGGRGCPRMTLCWVFAAPFPPQPVKKSDAFMFLHIFRFLPRSWIVFLTIFQPPPLYLDENIYIWESGGFPWVKTGRENRAGPQRAAWGGCSSSSQLSWAQGKVWNEKGNVLLCNIDRNCETNVVSSPQYLPFLFLNTFGCAASVHTFGSSSL